MGYYIRVLSKKRDAVPVAEIDKALQAAQVQADVQADEGDEDWEVIHLAHPDGTVFCAVERCPVAPGSLGAAELEEFIEAVQLEQPKSAAKWLAEYLPCVQTIYALQVLSAADDGDGWDATHAAQNALWSAGGGILQADGEGFSNEDGNHILWEFSDGASGPWQMAVLNADGSWAAFEMDLGNPEHRRAFLDGRIPSGVARV